MEFKFLGGHPAIDFINTVGGRTYTSANRYTVDRDRLESAADFDEWLSLAKLDGPKARRSSRAILARAVALREALYRMFKAVIEQRRPDPNDSELFNRELAAARAHEKLTFIGGKPTFTWDDRDAPELPLWIIARAAAELLTSPEIARVRACGGESCGWLFLDTSRNRSRQWCDMADCGNVAKVRRFRDRQRDSG